MRQQNILPLRLVILPGRPAWTANRISPGCYTQ